MIESGEKMIVVVIVLSVILLGIAAFLFYIESRLDRAEKKLRELESEKQKAKSIQNTFN
jgi:Tfp pilus assembly protein PilO